MCVCVCVCVCVYHIFFIHLSVDGYLHCFHILAIVISVAMNIGMHYLSKLEFLSFPGIYSGVGLLNHMVVLFVVV